MDRPRIIAVIGPTASGKTAKSLALARERDGEVISVDSRQVYRTLDIGTEKISPEEMGDVPHHLIDIRDPEETYSAGDFANDAAKLIADIQSRGKTPILAGGTHFYLDALLYGLPNDPVNHELRHELEKKTAEELFAELEQKDPRRAARIDRSNPRRLIRALEIVSTRGSVPERSTQTPAYDVEWYIIDLPRDELRARIDTRLKQALGRGLIEEVKRTRARVGDARLTELGLEYRIIGEYLRGERTEDSLLPALSSALWRYARQQKQWLKRLGHS
ncbi:MAG TPA: tRNA (adenosine(37)-N6)-dimethylallyltransferase MiaA [Candidatus Paceibacterota bacterium]|nr:tRNA (adenosine(37)-N6)-dimethylallyltransferase MiaA [Candidatus Paceibacterota bacterium]